MNKKLKATLILAAILLVVAALFTLGYLFPAIITIVVGIGAICLALYGLWSLIYMSIR